MHKPGIRRGCCSRLLLHVARRFQLFRYPPPDAMSLGHGDIQRAVAILRRAMDNGLDLSGEFAGWTVLQRRSLVQALGGVLPATPPAFGAAAADHGAADPAPEPPADLDAPPSEQVASGAAAGPTSIPSYPAKPGDGTVDQSGATPAQAKGPPASQWESEGFRSYSDALAAENMGYLTDGDYYARIAAPPVKKAPAVPPPEVKRQPAKFPPARPASSAASSSSAQVPGTPEFARLQAEIEEEIRAGASSRPTSSTLAVAEPKAGQPDHPPAPPAGFINMRIGADWFVINRTTGEGYPPCPRKPPRDATARARAENEEEFRRIVGIYRLLNSLEHTAHIERMHRPGATADFPLPPAMVPSAVRTIDELEERERAADAAPGGHGGLIPVAPGAADFIVTSLAPNFRGGRVAERIPGEVWVVGWCAAPCPGLDGMPCIDRGGRCLRPVIVRRGGGANLEAHTGHLCDQCRRKRNTRDGRY